MPLPESHEVTCVDGRVLRLCRYGPADGFPVIFHSGSPSTRWKRPDQIEVMEQSGLCLLVYDRPGYGGSTRQQGRTVVDAVRDVATLADAHGWTRFGVFGGSGGGPHALACAALLADRVTRCAVVSGIKPREPLWVQSNCSAPKDADSPPEGTDQRPELKRISDDIMAKIAAGGPEFPTAPGAEPLPPAIEDPDAMARLRATFVDSFDGWADDSFAFARPWGFEPSSITVPVGIWHGKADTTVPGEHSEWLLAQIKTAQDYEYAGGHLPDAAVYRQIYAWLAGLGDDRLHVP